MNKSMMFPIFFVVMLMTSCAQNQDTGINDPKNISFSTELIVKGIQNPWGMAFLGENSILISEKSGKLLLHKSGQTTEINGLPEICVQGQGGFMDLELHPG